MSRRQRILMTADAVGGVWQYSCELAGALTHCEYEILLALLGPPASDSQRQRLAELPGMTLVETGLPLDWLAGDRTTVEAAAGEIAELAWRAGADLVHLNQPALAVAEYSVPLVAAAHSCVATWWEAAGSGEEPAEFAWQTELVCEGLHRADAVVCPSHAFAEAIRRRYRLSSLPEVIHNGRTPLSGSNGALHDFAFTAGRLWDRGKNLATLDRAAGRLGIPFKAAGPLVGPNGERIAFEHLQSLGTVDERILAGCISARPVFVSAARYEPFGLAVLEAALSGCALVLSDIPTFRELWGGVALFVEPDDAIGFAETIEMLIGEMPMRLQLGEQARTRAQRFTPERMAAQIDGIYRRLTQTTATIDGRAAA
jgi:glycosyltransferase involved in cell wall biosynthesis